MKKDELHYDLPPELIAQHPADRRDASRLLVLDRAGGPRRHEVFHRLPELLPPRSLLVMNNTRVLPARLLLQRRSGGRLEGLFLRETEPGLWEVMLTSSGRLKVGEELEFIAERVGQRRLAGTPSELPGSSPSLNPSPRTLRLTERLGEGRWLASPQPPGEAVVILSEVGHPPLPPYIRRQRQGRAAASPVAGGPSGGEDDPADVERYQTVYAQAPGSVAAPTAGLHFTPQLLDRLRAADFQTAFVTLHVGPGTFAPIRADDLARHEMHSEWYECTEVTADAVNAAHREGRKVVAVGTTSVRVLESCADSEGQVRAGSGWTDIFIYPPYRFRAVDTLLTNFHLPESTLLALVFAFAGRDATLAAYQDAIKHRYRFYSYGDAMLVL